MNPTRTGVAAAIAAFSLWGMLPLFWKQLTFLSPGSIAAQRTLWSLVILLALISHRGEAASLLRCLRSPRAAAWHFMSGSLLAANWLLYIWATLNGRILEGALGYYLNPFFNMLFGALWFGERHNGRQLAAILLALCGVALQIPAAQGFPWVAVTLAVTFSLYAVVKKRSPLGSRIGLTLETGMLAPLAAGWLLFETSRPAALFGASPGQAALVVSSGLATVLPLVFFGHAARKIPLTTLGILQFLGPTLQFIIGWLFYGESMTPSRLLTFVMVWSAIALYAADAWLQGRSRKG